MSGEWRSHPGLAGRFHPEAPDDVQVIVHEGGPLSTSASPELVWVRVTSVVADGVFRGTVLNAPQQLAAVSQGATIEFLATQGEHLLMVTDGYRAEREAWTIRPCEECGLDELFDPPSVLIEATFDRVEASDTVEAFTARCGVCGGTQIVSLRDADDLDKPSPPSRRKRWWQLWT